MRDLNLFPLIFVDSARAIKFPNQGRKDGQAETAAVPGPGNYFNDKQGKIKGGVIGTEKRTFIGPGNPNLTGDHLGPGYYAEDYNFKVEQSKKNTRGPKIGTANSKGKKHIPTASDFKTPGPGSYSHQKDATVASVNGGTIAKTGRAASSYKDKVPGPGQYGKSNMGGMSAT